MINNIQMEYSATNAFYKILGNPRCSDNDNGILLEVF